MDYGGNDEGEQQRRAFIQTNQLDLHLYEDKKHKRIKMNFGFIPIEAITSSMVPCPRINSSG
jgi:hypothetical protein